MLDIFYAIWNAASTAVRWIISTFKSFITASKMITSIYYYADHFLYLIPGFLAYFALLYMIIFIVNRVLNGRN